MLYCLPCTTCPHGRYLRSSAACPYCLRQLYTIWTFEGPRIRNLAVYRHEARTRYGVRAYDLMYWTFDEEELAAQDAENDDDTVPVSVSPGRAPPHHFIET